MTTSIQTIIDKVITMVLPYYVRQIFDIHEIVDGVDGICYEKYALQWVNVDRFGGKTDLFTKIHVRNARRQLQSAKHNPTNVSLFFFPFSLSLSHSFSSYPPKIQLKMKRKGKKCASIQVPRV